MAEYQYGDRLISLATPGTTQYYHHDALGSTVNLTGVTGAAEAEYVLDPWGKITAQTGDSVNRQIFTGQEHDENTGLIYFGARYYDPDIARFITQDAYLGEAGVPPSLHRYLYAYSNPGVYVDLDGNLAVSTAIGIGIVAGAVVDYLFSDRREKVAKQIGSNSSGDYLVSNTIALTQSVSNTVTFGYFDATMQPGGVGAIEHTVQMSGYRSYEDAYEVITSESYDSLDSSDVYAKKMLAGLYIIKGMGETSSSILLLHGAHHQLTAGARAKAAHQEMVNRLLARERAIALEKAAIAEESIALDSRKAIRLADLRKKYGLTDDLDYNINRKGELHGIAMEKIKERVNSMSMRQRRRHEVIIGAYDVETGAVVVDFNGPPPSNVHGKLIEKSQHLGSVGFPSNLSDTTNKIGRCAEFRTANPLLHMGSKFEHIRWTKAVRPRKISVTVEMCPNCKDMFY